MGGDSASQRTQVQGWANAPMRKHGKTNGHLPREGLSTRHSSCATLQQSSVWLHVTKGHPPSSLRRHSGEHIIIPLRLSSRNSRPGSKFHLCHVLTRWLWPSNQLQSHPLHLPSLYPALGHQSCTPTRNQDPNSHKFHQTDIPHGPRSETFFSC